MTGTLVDQHCHAEVYEELTKKCNAGSYPGNVCERIHGVCKQWWATAFQGSFTPHSVFGAQSCPVGL